MSLIKWTPLFSDFPFDDMEKAFSDFMPVVRGNSSGFVPAIDMYEEKDKVVVETQLAGIDPEKVDISIEDDVLCIKGESEKKSEVEDKNYYRKEIKRGSFYRTIQLPSHVDGSQAKAVNQEGILKISIPKIKKSESKKIKIETKNN